MKHIGFIYPHISAGSAFMGHICGMYEAYMRHIGLIYVANRFYMCIYLHIGFFHVGGS